jgi:DNA-nicking Smr family endonuclease
VESTRTPFGHNPFKGLKSLLREAPPAGPKGSKGPEKPLEPPAAENPETERQVFLRAMEGTRPMTDRIGRKERESRLRRLRLRRPRGGDRRGDEGPHRLRPGIRRGRHPRVHRGAGVPGKPEDGREASSRRVSPSRPTSISTASASRRPASPFEDFLRESVIRNRRSLLVIHGRGLSSQGEPVLKAKVTEWRTRGPWRKWVIAYSSARLCDGGAGATYILLRTRPVTKSQKKSPAREQT